MRSLGTDQYVEEVERRLGAFVAAGRSSGSAVLAEAGGHLVLAGGKRLRPRLVELFGSACGAPRPALVDLGVVAELLHAASLLHDDVVDEGRMRRGVPTANVAYGNARAVLAGDWLLSGALSLLRPYSRPVLEGALAVVSRMTLAAAREVDARGRVDLEPASWREIAEGKTGALFGWCGEAPALLGGDRESAQRFARFGRHLGVAFQLADDLRDLGGDAGKDRFSDLRQRQPSLPIVLAAGASPEFRRRLASTWSQDPIAPACVADLGQSILAEGHAAAAREALDAELEQAFCALGPHRDTAWGRTMAGLARDFSRHLSPERPA
jgi:octaprenyl-diphosphate synthase